MVLRLFLLENSEENALVIVKFGQITAILELGILKTTHLTQLIALNVRKRALKFLADDISLCKAEKVSRLLPRSKMQMR